MAIPPDDDVLVQELPDGTFRRVPQTAEAAPISEDPTSDDVMVQELPDGTFRRIGEGESVQAELPRDEPFDLATEGMRALESTGEALAGAGRAVADVFTTDPRETIGGLIEAARGPEGDLTELPEIDDFLAQESQRRREAGEDTTEFDQLRNIVSIGQLTTFGSDRALIPAIRKAFPAVVDFIEGERDSVIGVDAQGKPLFFINAPGLSTADVGSALTTGIMAVGGGMLGSAGGPLGIAAGVAAGPTFGRQALATLAGSQGRVSPGEAIGRGAASFVTDVGTGGIARGLAAATRAIGRRAPSREVAPEPTRIEPDIEPALQPAPPPLGEPVLPGAVLGQGVRRGQLPRRPAPEPESLLQPGATPDAPEAPLGALRDRLAKAKESPTFKKDLSDADIDLLDDVAGGSVSESVQTRLTDLFTNPVRIRRLKQAGFLTGLALFAQGIGLPVPPPVIALAAAVGALPSVGTIRRGAGAISRSITPPIGLGTAVATQPSEERAR